MCLPWAGVIRTLVPRVPVALILAVDAFAFLQDARRFRLAIRDRCFCCVFSFWQRIHTRPRGRRRNVRIRPFSLFAIPVMRLSVAQPLFAGNPSLLEQPPQ